MSLQKCLMMCKFWHTSHQELRKAKTLRWRKDTLAPVFLLGIAPSPPIDATNINTLLVSKLDSTSVNG